MHPDEIAPVSRIRAIIADAGGGHIEPGDFAVVSSLVATLSELEISAVMDEFFDIEPLILVLSDRFRRRQTEWTQPVRQKLLEALVFCGHDEEADYMMLLQAQLGPE